MGDDRELARRAAVFHSIDPSWEMPIYLAELLSYRHDQYSASWAHPPAHVPHYVASRDAEVQTPLPPYNVASRDEVQTPLPSYNDG